MGTDLHTAPEGSDTTSWVVFAPLRIWRIHKLGSSSILAYQNGSGTAQKIEPSFQSRKRADKSWTTLGTVNRITPPVLVRRSVCKDQEYPWNLPGLWQIHLTVQKSNLSPHSSASGHSGRTGRKNYPAMEKFHQGSDLRLWGCSF